MRLPNPNISLSIILITVTGLAWTESAWAQKYPRDSFQQDDQSELRPAMSLLDAYLLARAIDPELAIAGYEVDGAAARRDESRGQFLPQVSIFGDWSENKLRYESDELSSMPSREYPGERYGLQLRSPLFNMRAFREYERRGALTSQTEEELKVAETDLLSRVTRAYLTMLLADETVVHLESELSALEQQLREVDALYARSLVPVTQVLETQARADALRADEIDAKGQAALARERLSQIVGTQNLRVKPVSEHISVMTEVRDADEAAVLAQGLDPAVAAAEQALKAAEKSVAREKGSWWPNIDFVYVSQYSDVGFDNLTSPPRSSESYSVSLRYPIFQGGAGSARLRGAWAEVYSARQKLEAVNRESSSRAREAWINFETASGRLIAARKATETAEVTVDASRKAARAGTARVSDVLLALARNTRTQRDLSEAKFQKAMAWLEVELATGSNPATLAPILSRALHGQ